MASASNHASTSHDKDDEFDIEAMLNEINAIYEAGEEMFKDVEVIAPDCMEIKRRRNLRVESKASISQSDSSFSSDRPEPCTSRSSERTESVNLEETDSCASSERQADMSHFSTSSETGYSSDSSDSSERSRSTFSSIPRVRLDSSSSSEDSSVPSEHPVDPMENLNEHRGLLDSFEHSESEGSLDSLESSDSESTDDDNLSVCDEQQVTQYSEADDVDAIAEHDHLFNVRILYPEENVFDSPAYVTVYRSAIEHSLVGFSYKWGRYVNETSEVCLLQFCSVEGLVIFHKIRRDIMYVPPILEEILSNENICKVGIFPGPIFGTDFYLKNALDLRYAIQICGMTPKTIEDIVESILGYSINLYRGTRPTDKYFLATDAQYRTAFLEVYFGLQIFVDVRIDYNSKFENNFDRLCEIYKGKIYRMGRPM